MSTGFPSKFKRASFRARLGALIGVGGAIASGFAAGRAILPHEVPSTPQRADFSSLDGNRPATWVVSGDPGPNLPPLGRSLFDFVTTVDDGSGRKKQVIPFPFTKLVALIRERVRPEAATTDRGMKGVLIPLGRSLQRSASAPDFFKFPRVVVGVDGSPVQDADGEFATGVFLCDRLFLGYNEKASVLEVVSYNESAGRYEFQVAHDYKAGGDPHVAYANRSVCLSCHQNATPIFSDRPWQETNANPEITAQLRAAMADHPDYMGVPLAVSEAQPQALDNAKFRANLIPVTHFLWQRLCEGVDGSVEGGARCRGQALALAIKMGFTNQLDETSPLFFTRETASFLATLATTWKRLWPAGLLISNPRIPNRNPFEKPKNPGPFDVASLRPDIAGALGGLIKTSSIPAEFEPLNKRPALDQWSVLSTNGESTPDVSGLANWLRQIVGFFTDVDFTRIESWMSDRAAGANARVQADATCEAGALTLATAVNGPGALSKISFACAGLRGDDPIRLAGFLTWDALGKANGAMEALAVRADQECALGAASDAGVDADDRPADQARMVATCPEARNLVLRGQVTATGDGVYQAILTATNRINARRTRLSDGNLLESITLRWKKGTAVAVGLKLLRDFPYFEQAIAQLVQETVDGRANTLAKRPLRRTAILTALRAAFGGERTVPGDCCEADQGMPTPASDEQNPVIDQQLALIAGPAAPFMKDCAICHRNSSGFPPNYLSGSLRDVQKQISGCAERIWYRLNMYDVAKADRGQSPMPPMARLDALGMTEAQWRESGTLKSLRAAAAEILRAKGVEPPSPQIMRYQTLPECIGN